MDAEETVGEIVALHYGLEPVDVAVLSDEIVRVDVSGPVAGDPGVDVAPHAAREVGEEGEAEV